MELSSVLQIPLQWTNSLVPFEFFDVPKASGTFYMRLFIGSSSLETGSWWKLPNIYFHSQNWDGRYLMDSKNSKSHSTLNLVFTRRFNGFRLNLKSVQSLDKSLLHLEMCFILFLNGINDYDNNKLIWQKKFTFIEPLHTLLSWEVAVTVYGSHPPCCLFKKGIDGGEIHIA